MLSFLICVKWRSLHIRSAHQLGLSTPGLLTSVVCLSDSAFGLEDFVILENISCLLFLVVNLLLLFFAIGLLGLLIFNTSNLLYTNLK